MRKAVKIEVSKSGQAVRIVYDDGSERHVSFENFLESFGSFSRALNEYCAYISAVSNESALSGKAIREIRAKLGETETVIIPSSMFNEIQRLAEILGETVDDFVIEAVERRIKEVKEAQKRG